MQTNLKNVRAKIHGQTDDHMLRERIRLMLSRVSSGTIWLEPQFFSLDFLTLLLEYFAACEMLQLIRLLYLDLEFPPDLQILQSHCFLKKLINGKYPMLYGPPRWHGYQHFITITKCSKSSSLFLYRLVTVKYLYSLMKCIKPIFWQTFYSSFSLA